MVILPNSLVGGPGVFCNATITSERALSRNQAGWTWEMLACIGASISLSSWGWKCSDHCISLCLRCFLRLEMFEPLYFLCFLTFDDIKHQHNYICLFFLTFDDPKGNMRTYYVFFYLIRSPETLGNTLVFNAFWRQKRENTQGNIMWGVVNVGFRRPLDLGPARLITCGPNTAHRSPSACIWTYVFYYVYIVVNYGDLTACWPLACWPSRCGLLASALDGPLAAGLLATISDIVLSVS